MSEDYPPTYDILKVENPLGLHTLVECIECDQELLARADLLEPIFLRAIEVCGATYVDHRMKQFEPHGVSGVVLIAESHLSFHSWPEHRYMAIDLFTCSFDMDSLAAMTFIADEVKAKECRTRVIQRGF